MLSLNCVCGEKAFQLTNILVNRSSAANVERGSVCYDCGKKRTKELENAFRKGEKELLAILESQEKFEPIES